MLARLSIAGLAFLALTFFALQAWGTTPSTAIESTAERSLDAPESPVSSSSEASDDGNTVDEARGGAVGDVARQVREGAQADRILAQGDTDDVTLTLLHNNDGESKLLPNIEGGFPGIARFAEAWVDLGRNSEADILLRVSSGDNFLASKEFAASLALEDQPLYDSIALRGLYEAMALGNHDFDFGPEVTARFIEGFRLNESSDPVTFLAANLDVNEEPALAALVESGRLAPSTIYTDPTSGLDVGIIGAITPRLANISSPRNVVVDADVAGAVNAEAAALVEQGVERIVLISHLQGLDEDRDLVPQLSNVDIVVAGGGDELLKNAGDTCLAEEEAVDTYPLFVLDADGNDVPVVTAPGGYRCIGRLDVTFDGDGNISVVEGSSIGVPLDGATEEFAMARVEEPLQAALADLDAAVVGESDVELDGRRNSVRTGATNVGELLADAILASGRQAPDFGGVIPVVAVQNGGGIRNDAVLPAGEITEADTFDIAPFANFVVTGEVTRERFKELLEVGVAGLPDAEGTYPQIAGFTMEIDGSQPAREVDDEGDCSLVGDPGGRVQNVTLDDGTEIVRDGVVVPGDPIGLATIDFLAGGGDCYPLDDIEFVKVGSSYQQALSGFISDDLDGVVSSEAYPAGGSRAVLSNLDPDDAADDEADTGTDVDTDDTDSADGADSGADGTDDSESGSTDDEADDTDELPNTGLEIWLYLIVASTVAAAGWLIFGEAKRAGWLSLTNRLGATRAWFPDDD